MSLIQDYLSSKEENKKYRILNTYDFNSGIELYVSPNIIYGAEDEIVLKYYVYDSQGTIYDTIVSGNLFHFLKKIKFEIKKEDKEQIKEILDIFNGIQKKVNELISFYKVKKGNIILLKLNELFDKNNLGNLVDFVYSKGDLGNYYLIDTDLFSYMNSEEKYLKIGNIDYLSQKECILTTFNEDEFGEFYFGKDSIQIAEESFEEGKNVGDTLYDIIENAEYIFKFGTKEGLKNILSEFDKNKLEHLIEIDDLNKEKDLYMLVYKIIGKQFSNTDKFVGYGLFLESYKLKTFEKLKNSIREIIDNNNIEEQITVTIKKDGVFVESGCLFGEKIKTL